MLNRNCGLRLLDLCLYFMFVVVYFLSHWLMSLSLDDTIFGLCLPTNLADYFPSQKFYFLAGNMSIALIGGNAHAFHSFTH